jgi:hypothetical protein
MSDVLIDAVFFSGRVTVDEFAKSRFSATEVTDDSEKYHIFQDVNSVISVSSVAKIALLQLHHCEAIKLLIPKLQKLSLARQRVMSLVSSLPSPSLTSW